MARRYEWAQHVAIAGAAGLTDDEIRRVAAGPDAAGWSADDAAVLRAVDELHDDHCIGDATWTTLAARYDTEQLIEIPMLAGHYAMLAGVLNSLGVQPESRRPARARRGLTWATGSPGRPRSSSAPVRPPGATIGNGRATALLFAQEGARVLLVDRDDESVQRNAAISSTPRCPGAASTFVADIVDEDACVAIVAHALDVLGAGSTCCTTTSASAPATAVRPRSTPTRGIASSTRT